MSKTKTDILDALPDLPCTVFAFGDERIERAYKIVNAVWQRIPALERVRILNVISAWEDTKVIALIIDDWKHSFGTNAIFFPPGERACIEIDAGYFDAADDENIMTTMAHEFGHLLGLLDDDLSEERQPTTTNTNGAFLTEWLPTKTRRAVTSTAC